MGWLELMCCCISMESEIEFQSLAKLSLFGTVQQKLSITGMTASLSFSVRKELFEQYVTAHAAVLLVSRHISENLYSDITEVG